MISLRVYQLSKLAKVFFSTFVEFLYVYQRVVLGDPQKAWQHDASPTKSPQDSYKSNEKLFPWSNYTEICYRSAKLHEVLHAEF